MGFLDALNPVNALVNTVKGVIGMFVTDPSKKLELESQIEAQQAAIEASIIEASKETILAEESGTGLQRAWRPIVALGLFATIFYAGPLVSLFHLPQISMVGVPPELWSTFKVMVGGYMALRSGEKVTTGIVGYLKGKDGNGVDSNGQGS